MSKRACGLYYSSSLLHIQQEMAGLSGTAKVPSLPPPRPKSPPEYPDLYGKRRELAKVQLLEREIGFLEVSFNIVANSLFSFFFLYRNERWLESNPRSKMMVKIELSFS